MDGTENEHPDINASGFPTLIMFPADKDAKPVPFEGGDRSLKVHQVFLCSQVGPSDSIRPNYTKNSTTPSLA